MVCCGIRLFPFFFFFKVLESVSAERLKTQCINLKNTQVFTVRFISTAEFQVCVILFVSCLKYTSRAVAVYIFVHIIHWAWLQGVRAERQPYSAHHAMPCDVGLCQPRGKSTFFYFPQRCCMGCQVAWIAPKSSVSLKSGQKW